MAISIRWAKPVLLLSVFFLIAWLLPSEPIDPWGIFSLKKAAYMVFALAFIQALGSAAIGFFGNRKGAIVTGFFGGLVSSTATTVSLARESRSSPNDETGNETLTFLAATLAMLCEGMVLLLLGPAEIHFSLLLIFLGPAVVSVLMIVVLARRLPHRESKAENIELEILPILKLAAAIILILTVSKLLQAFFGESGLLVLTFLVSLFEIHGSVIANIQMHEAGAFTVKFLGGLLAISITASYLSKLFLVHSMGSRGLRNNVVKATGILLLTLIMTSIVFILVA